MTTMRVVVVMMTAVPVIVMRVVVMMTTSPVSVCLAHLALRPSGNATCEAFGS
ncbi:hypothetical protein ACYOEI_30060 [Singulisphaera rosea]